MSNMMPGGPDPADVVECECSNCGEDTCAQNPLCQFHGEPNPECPVHGPDYSEDVFEDAVPIFARGAE